MCDRQNDAEQRTLQRGRERSLSAAHVVRDLHHVSALSSEMIASEVLLYGGL